MSETQQANGTVQPANAATQLPNGNGAAQQTQTLSPEQITQLQRAAQQYNGAAPLINKALSYGLKNPTDFDAWGPVIKHFRESGTDPKQLLAAFSGNASAASDQIGKEPEQWTKADIEKMVGERVTKATADAIRQQAEREHQNALGAETEELERDDTLESLFGDLKDVGKDPKVRELMKYAVAGYHAFNARSPYGDDHPLRGVYGPAGRDGMGKIKSWAGESVKAFATAIEASRAAQIGKGARTATTSAATNNNGVSQGPPKSERKSHLPTRAELEAALEERMAARKR